MERVGRALAERDGTHPEDHPPVATISRRSRAAAFAEGRAEGFAEGRAEGRVGLVRAILGSRGIAGSREFPPPRFRARLATASDTALASAAFSASSEADFLARLG